jgi:hypothetical protein
MAMVKLSLLSIVLREGAEGSVDLLSPTSPQLPQQTRSRRALAFKFLRL